MEVHSSVERRRHPRLYEPFPVLVRSVDAGGAAFESPTVLANFSARGLYVRLRQRLEPGARLFAVVRIASAIDLTVDGPRVAVRGMVVHSEPQPDGRYGVGVVFTRHRFLCKKCRERPATVQPDRVSTDP